MANNRNTGFTGIVSGNLFFLFVYPPLLMQKIPFLTRKTIFTLYCVYLWLLYSLHMRLYRIL